MEAHRRMTHIHITLTISLLTYLQLYLLEIKDAQLRQFVDDIEPVMLLVCHRIPQQAEKSLQINYRLNLNTFFKIRINHSNLRRLSVFTVASGSRSPWNERKYSFLIRNGPFKADRTALVCKTITNPPLQNNLEEQNTVYLGVHSNLKLHTNYTHQLLNVVARENQLFQTWQRLFQVLPYTTGHTLK